MKTTTKSLIITAACVIGLAGGYVVSDKFWSTRTMPPEDNIPQVNIESNFVREWIEKTDYFRSTPYGNYLIGNFAQKEKDWDSASDYIALVLQKEKTDELLKHAMVLAMGAGEIKKGLSLADQVLEINPQDLLATLFKAAENFKSENYDAVLETLKPISQDSIAAFIVPVLYLWAQAAKGELNTERLNSNTFFIYQTFMAGDFLNKKDEALAFAAENFSLSSTDIRDLEKIADYYAIFGKINKAKDIYGLLAKEKFASDEVKKKLAALENNQPIEKLLEMPNIKSPKDGAAQVFLSMAQILIREQSYDSGLIFTQLSLYLNENIQEARMLLARILTVQEQYDDAILVYEEIPETHKKHVLAQRGIANLLVEKDEHDKAIKILEGIYDEYQDLDALIQIGDIYRYQEDYNAAVKTYNRVVNTFETVPEEYWHVLYARGMAYERLKKFEKSEKDLLAALEFRPDHPFLLNYLGYSWADQGINLTRAQEMINRAFEIKPDDGYIADSVGWVHFKIGNYEDAIQYLETAVELLPYDATINDHLGDAYWKVGRKTEAEFQWKRAMNNTKENEVDLKERILVKLSYGYMTEEKIAEYIEKKK
jgi:tetratricopeptide (TPR) repeat protein